VTSAIDGSRDLLIGGRFLTLLAELSLGQLLSRLERLGLTWLSLLTRLARLNGWLAWLNLSRSNLAWLRLGLGLDTLSQRHTA
jgi:hypothetical protein